MSRKWADGAIERKYKSPCYGCSARTAICHGTCIPYLEYRRKEEKHRLKQYLKEKRW